MGKRARGGRTVGIVSSHPLVEREVAQVLESGPFRVRTQQVEGSPVRQVDVTVNAPLYIVDGELPRPIDDAIVTSIATRFPRSRVLCIAETFREADAFRLLRQGVKGLVRYRELETKLHEALETVATGGLWVPRALLSRFLDEMLTRSSRRIASTSGAVSTREREVLACVLEGSSNKEIAAKLHISERTVKFHVSNLLAKFEVQTRQQLIGHCLSVLPGAP